MTSPIRRVARRVRLSLRRLILRKPFVERRDFLEDGKWNYEHVDQFAYGDETSYRKGMAFLDGHGAIEDWGCGTAWAKRFATQSAYIGLDSSKSRFVDKVVDLRTYTSNADCIFMRHVLEHTPDWKTILTNAVGSFRRRMALVIFTPFGDETRQIAMWSGIPDISFREEDLTDCFRDLRFSAESLLTGTQYGMERIFFIEKGDPAIAVTEGHAEATQALSAAEPAAGPRASRGKMPA
jgi:hypothetical protein